MQPQHVVTITNVHVVCEAILSLVILDINQNHHRVFTKAWKPWITRITITAVVFFISHCAVTAKQFYRLSTETGKNTISDTFP